MKQKKLLSRASVSAPGEFRADLTCAVMPVPGSPDSFHWPGMAVFWLNALFVAACPIKTCHVIATAPGTGQSPVKKFSDASASPGKGMMSVIRCILQEKVRRVAKMFTPRKQMNLGSPPEVEKTVLMQERGEKHSVREVWGGGARWWKLRKKAEDSGGKTGDFRGKDSFFNLFVEKHKNASGLKKIFVKPDNFTKKVRKNEKKGCFRKIIVL